MAKKPKKRKPPPEPCGQRHVGTLVEPCCVIGSHDGRHVFWTKIKQPDHWRIKFLTAEGELLLALDLTDEPTLLNACAAWAFMRSEKKVPQGFLTKNLPDLHGAVLV